MAVDNSWLIITKVYAIVMIIVTLALAGGMIYLGVKISRLVDLLTRSGKSVIGRAEKTAESVSQTVQTLSEHTRRISQVAEETTERMAAKVDAASELVQEAVTRPVIALSALVAGIRRGVEVFAGSRSRRSP